MNETYIDEMEEIVTEVANRAAEEIQAVIDTLAPDGRPFGQEKKSIEQQLDEYRTIRNDVEAWKVWISNKALEITNPLMMGGVEQEKIDAVNPLAIAIAYMNDYSVRMEKLLAERMV